MIASYGNDRMFGLSRRQEMAARIVELLKEQYPQVAAAMILTSSPPFGAGGIPLAILLREGVDEPEVLSMEIRQQLEQAVGTAFSLVLLEEPGSPEEAGLLRGGQLILDRDPRFRAAYTWTAGKGFPASLTTGGRQARCAEGAGM
jgi:hypothetical protein